MPTSLLPALSWLQLLLLLRRRYVRTAGAAQLHTLAHHAHGRGTGNARMQTQALKYTHAVLFAAGLLLGQTSISAGKKCYL